MQQIICEIQFSNYDDLSKNFHFYASFDCKIIPVYM